MSRNTEQAPEKIEPGRKDAGHRGRGRPFAFDRRRAVDQAMCLFWERGYEGASFNALREAMGLSASSLTNAFGSKEGLYREAVQQYNEGPAHWYIEALTAPVTTRDAFEMLIASAAATAVRPGLPVGCMVAIAAMQTAPDLDMVRQFATECRQASQAALADRIRCGIKAGDVPAGTDAEVLAAYFAAVFRGMAVQARDGASPAELAQVGAYAMRAWPANSGSEKDP